MLLKASAIYGHDPIAVSLYSLGVWGHSPPKDDGVHWSGSGRGQNTAALRLPEFTPALPHPCGALVKLLPLPLPSIVVAVQSPGCVQLFATPWITAR